MEDSMADSFLSCLCAGQWIQTRQYSPCFGGAQRPPYMTALLTELLYAECMTLLPRTLQIEGKILLGKSQLEFFVFGADCLTL